MDEQQVQRAISILAITRHFPTYARLSSGVLAAMPADVLAEAKKREAEQYRKSTEGQKKLPAPVVPRKGK